MGELRIIDYIVTAQSQRQPVNPYLWRRGPEWSIPPQSGRWIVTTMSVYPAAIRVAFDRSVPLKGQLEFGHELDYWKNGRDQEDEQLRALDVSARLPERMSVSSGGKGYSAPVPVSIEDTLAELNEKARRELDAGKYPLPDGCPDPGTWIRAALPDEDAQAVPDGLWHYTTGWNAHMGVLGLRCKRRGNWKIWKAMERVDSVMGQWNPRRLLLRSPEQAAEDACQRCLRLSQ